MAAVTLLLVMLEELLLLLLVMDVDEGREMSWPMDGRE